MKIKKIASLVSAFVVISSFLSYYTNVDNGVIFEKNSYVYAEGDYKEYEENDLYYESLDKLRNGVTSDGWHYTVMGIGETSGRLDYETGIYEYKSTEELAVMITGADDAKGKLIIPSKIEGLPVYEIGDKAFQRNENITSVVIPDTVFTINSCAFYKCSAIETVDLGEGLNEIEYEAFRECTSLKCIEFPKSTVYVGGCAFYECTSLEKVKFKGELREINSYCFTNCHNLSSVNIPNTVNFIGELAFYDCFQLKSVYIPSTVKKIYREAFGITQIDELIDGFRIYGVNGTVAEEYADKYGIPFNKAKEVTYNNDISLSLLENVGDIIEIVPSQSAVDKNSNPRWYRREDENSEWVQVESEDGHLIVEFVPECNNDEYCYADQDKVEENSVTEIIKLQVVYGSYGDVNYDRNIDLLDLTEISLHLLGDKSLDGDNLARADVTGNDGVNIADLAYIKSYIMKEPGVEFEWYTKE